jgi:hypothetical protein
MQQAIGATLKSESGKSLSEQQVFLSYELARRSLSFQLQAGSPCQRRGFAA